MPLSRIRQFTPAAFDGPLSIVDDYVWTLNASNEAKDYVPRITINFKQQTSGQITQGLNRWWEIISSVDFGSLIDGDPYKGMYLAEEIGEIIFPYFSADYINLMQSFQGTHGIDDVGKMTKDIGGKFGKAVSEKVNAVVNLAGTAANIASSIVPGVLIEKPGVWASTSPTQTSFSFYLYNTLEQSIPGSIEKNKNMIDRLIYLNSIQKVGPALLLPPVICSYDIPGIKFGPVASMALNITSIGQMTYKDGKNVPDAYFVTITLNDLLVRSRNMHGLNGPSKVNAFSTGGDE